jgi:hypothetical protein
MVMLLQSYVLREPTIRLADPSQAHASRRRFSGNQEGEKHMKIQLTTTVTAAAIAALAAGTLTILGPAGAGGDKIAFPENYASGVMYMTFDGAANKTFRELYTSAAAAEAAKKGEPLPSGTVITMVQYAAKLDAAGNPEKDGNGRFIKTDTIAGYGVMEKRAGWGSEYPDNVRNGEWEYQVFKADKTVNTGAKLGACFECHKPQDKQDFVFSYEKLKTAAK